MQIAMLQTGLCICAVWSGLSLFAIYILGIDTMYADTGTPALTVMSGPSVKGTFLNKQTAGTQDSLRIRAVW